MAVAAGLFLLTPASGRAGRAGRHTRHGRLARAAPHGSPGAQEGPCAGQELRHQERQRRPASAGLLLKHAFKGNFDKYLLEMLGH